MMRAETEKGNRKRKRKEKEKGGNNGEQNVCCFFFCVCFISPRAGFFHMRSGHFFE